MTDQHKWLQDGSDALKPAVCAKTLPEASNSPASTSRPSPPLCPKCGHGVHHPQALDECPWWRFSVQWGDPARAVAAISELTGIAPVLEPGRSPDVSP